MNGCHWTEFELIKKSKSKEGQAQVLILQAIGHTCGAAWFKSSKGSRNGRGLQQELFQPAPWVAEGLRAGSKKKSWKNIKRQDLVHIATRGGRAKNKKRLDCRVDLAWSWITAAKKDGLQAVPQMYRLLCLAPTTEMPSAALLRAQMVEHLKCLTLETGLYVAQSCIPGGGYGLFTSVFIPKGRTVTFYDGVAFIANKEEWEKHKERVGWYKSIGLTSKNYASIAGFTSMDKLPASAGVVSLMNSLSPPQANCKEGYVDKKKPLLVIDGSPVFRVPTVVATRDIEPGTELFWKYAVFEHGLGDTINDAIKATRRAVVKLLLLAHRFDKGCPIGVLDQDVLQRILNAVSECSRRAP